MQFFSLVGQLATVRPKKIRGETASSQLAVLIVKKSLPSWHATIIVKIIAFTTAKLILVFTTTNINVDAP